MTGQTPTHGDQNIITVGDGEDDLKLSQQEYVALTEALRCELGDEDFTALMSQLGVEETASGAAQANAFESFQQWAATQPALREMIMVENVREIIPAILAFFKSLLSSGNSQAGARGA